MAFKIQDLMSDVLPEPAWQAAPGCPGGQTCGGGGFAAVSGKGGDKSPQCRPASHRDSPRPYPRPRPQDTAGLDLLHRQLRQALDGPRV